MIGKILKPKGNEAVLTVPTTANKATLIRVYNPTGANAVVTVARNTTGTSNLVSGSAALVGNGTIYTKEFTTGDAVVATSNTNGWNQIAVVNVITDNTHMNLTSTMTYSNTVGIIQKVYGNCTMVATSDQIFTKVATDTISATHSAVGVSIAFTN